jgi:sigma-B regulation protein RsbU (phosphoserine phosphatase)
VSPGPPKRRTRVGLLVDQLSNEYTETIFSEMVAAALEHGVDTICLVGGKLLPGDLTAFRHVVFDLATRASVDALLVLPPGGEVGTSDMVAFCRRFHSLPICGIAIPWTDYPSVLVDNETGLREGIRHLIEAHGRRRIAFIRGPELNPEAQRRYQVYRELLDEHGITFDPSLVAPGTFEYDGGIRGARLLLDEREGEFDAVVCANDSSAFGAIDELRRRRVRVPEEVAVIGFDDIRMSRHIEPALTTVRQPAREQVRRALRIVLAEVHGGACPPRQSILPAWLVVRESCGCPPYVHPSVYAKDGQADAGDLESMIRSTTEAAQRMRATGIVGAPDTNWPELLCAEFVAQLAGRATSFLGEFTRTLAVVAKVDGGVGDFHRIITVLVDLSQRHLRGDLLGRADLLLHAARVKVNGVVGRAPTRRRISVEGANRILLNTSGTLAVVTDLASLRERLAAGLAPVAIGGFYVCRYDADRGANAWSRLVVAHEPDHADRSLPAQNAGEGVAGGVRFPSEKLLPDGFLASDRAENCVVCPLDCGEGGSGYVVFQGWVGHGLVYEGLAGQIGHALGRIALLDRLVAEARAREIAEGRRLEGEMRIATQIQAGILPQDVRVEGLEVAAAMQAASEVAGDYYDVIPTERGCWIGIGDVSGHGLPAGLATLMVHSVVSGVSRRHPDGAPGELLAVVNSVFYDNVRNRMGQEQHATLTLTRYERSGRLVCAGAHEVILVCRAEDGRIDVIDTPGTWIGLVPDVRGLVPDTAFDLCPGDVMVLFTDGITEARSESGEMFGIDRLMAEVFRARGESVASIRDALVAAVERWAVSREDDMSLLVARHKGAPSAPGG